MSRLLVAAVALACAGACGQPARPAEIRWVLSPSHGEHARPDDLRALERELREAGSPPVRITVAASPAAAIETVGARQADLALLNVPEYLLARQEYRCRAAAQAIRQGGSREYSGVVVARTGSGASSLRDLDGERVAFVDEYSLSGYLLPAAALARAGVRVEPVFARTHERALQLVREGGVAAAAVHEGLAATDLVRVATVGPMPNEPLCVARGAPADADAVVAALRRLGETERGRTALRPLADIEGFGAVEDAAYARVLTELREAGRRLEDAVPGGRTIVWSNLSPILTGPP